MKGRHRGGLFDVRQASRVVRKHRLAGVVAGGPWWRREALLNGRQAWK